MTENLHFDVVITGGSTGGVAAALSLLASGMKVLMTEETDWLGGQLTSQGVSAPDENQYIEYFSAPASYYVFREGVRNYYRKNFRLSDSAQYVSHLNPGNCWVSRLSFEPIVGVKVIDGMLEKYLESDQLTVLYNAVPVNAEIENDVIKSVTYRLDDNTEKTCSAEIFIDASEIGDLLPVVGVEYAIGAEAKNETGEEHAPDTPQPNWIQSYTYPFVIEYRPGEYHVIEKPDNYEKNRDNQPYTLDVDYGDRIATYLMFGKAEGLYGSFWSYRRLIDKNNFNDPAYPNDLAMINWPGNDYVGGSFIDASEEEKNRLLKEAKDLALGFLYWLQTEVKRDDGGFGYPEFMLRKDLMGTEDGLSKYPYIRESRRIKGMTTVVEQDVSVDYLDGPRARFFRDSVGLGRYFIDIHDSGYKETAKTSAVYPFQIPLGSLIHRRVKNLVAGGKNLAVTHITNGTYRLHPIEWSIGEAAGMLVATSLSNNALPHQVWLDERLLRKTQANLIANGAPVFWFVDVPIGHPLFSALQFTAAFGTYQYDQDPDLKFYPEKEITPSDLATWAKGLKDGAKITAEKETAESFLSSVANKLNTKVPSLTAKNREAFVIALDKILREYFLK
ncbi:MAG: FAD-dependent oxidoreductase [Firmicutes bacterium]|nr:FAD-dependent oxidoreductase [Bacillota bacterium]MDD4263363.1 FAD-dependent oxidoreductase [Bacillota bacterium]MDD4693385.1 FAD-dependent oxidoreductase [Bacillota bacterium]